MNIVIVGGGFAGVKAALELSKHKFANIRLISDEPYFLYHATLYSTATGGNKSESVVPLVDIFAGKDNVKVIRDKITTIDNVRKLVGGQNGTYKYDKLIIGIGNVTNFYGVSGMKEHAFNIKTLEGIKDFTSHIKKEVIDNQHLDRNYFVIGGGPTGIELVGALAEYLKHLVYVHKNTKGKIRVNVVESEDRILPKMSEAASRIVQKRLEELGVKVITGKKVDRLDDDYIEIDGVKTPTRIVVWTSGVSNNPIFKKFDHIFHLSESGRVNVDGYLEAAEDIYVIGDNNSVKYGGTAWPAVRQGHFVAKHLARLHNKQHLKPFRPLKNSSNLPVGKNWGYFEWFGVRIYGFLGYKIRRVIEYLGYRAILPREMSLIVWRSHYLKEIQDR